MFQTLLSTSPIGPIQITGTDEGITQLLLNMPLTQHPEEQSAHPLAVLAVEQLRAWFAGRLRTFQLPLRPAGTEFQQKVWHALQQIPWGQTASYAQIAADIGQPSACRAVGLANGRNPIPVIIPCHRIIGSNGRLVGYSGGLEIKRTLLTIEGSLLL